MSTPAYQQKRKHPRRVVSRGCSCVAPITRRKAQTKDMSPTRFGKFPSIERGGLTLAERGVLAQMYTFADQNGVLYVNQEKLARELEIGRSTLLRHLSALEHKGFLTRRHQYRNGGGYRTSEYRLSVVVKDSLKGRDNKSKTDPETTETTSHDVPESGQRDVPESGQQLHTVPKNSSQTVPSDGSRDGAVDRMRTETDDLADAGTRVPDQLRAIKSALFPNDPGHNGRVTLPTERLNDAQGPLWRDWEPNARHWRMIHSLRCDHGIVINPDALFAAWEQSAVQTPTGKQRVSANWGADLMAAIQIVAHDIDDAFELSPVFDERYYSENAEELIADYHWHAQDEHEESSPWSISSAPF